MATNDLNKMKPAIIRILKKYNVKKAGIFGSYARNENKKGSDVDILIEVDGSLLKVIEIEQELEEKLHKKVDLLTYGGINPLLRQRIIKEAVKII